MIRADEMDDGLVLDGEIYALEHADREWGACACTDAKHKTFFVGWSRSRADAEHHARATQGHVLRRVVAITHTEEEL